MAREESIKLFMNQFSFHAENTLKVGVERECHLMKDGKIVPIAKQVLEWLWTNNDGRCHCYGYELSACQLEDRTEKPCDLAEVKKLMLKNEADIQDAEKALGFRRVFLGAAPADIPLDHYPTERYDRIVQRLPRQALLAACRVTGVHILVGMPDHETALKVYNQVIKYFEMLCRLGYTFSSERLDLYEEVVDNADKISFSPRVRLFFEHLIEVRQPPPYADWQEFYTRACREGFVNDPRRLWDFIRISKHGAIEFRMFDTTSDLDRIVFWAATCRSLCETFL